MNRPEKLNALRLATFEEIDCYTGGLELVLAADLIVCAETGRGGNVIGKCSSARRTTGPDRAKD